MGRCTPGSLDRGCLAPAFGVDETMIDFEHWLHELSTRPLPGGVAAAAVASAMGAALVAKAARLTLRQQPLAGVGLQALLDLAAAQQAALLHLAGADERAYRSVLAIRAAGEPSPDQRRAWQEATEVPLRLAEACQSLLDRLPGLLDRCPSALKPDLQVGGWLLEAGRRAGLSAAESNLKAWGAAIEGESLQARVEALR
jgi:formiminotetrahydrofolate cyclodeaminase